MNATDKNDRKLQPEESGLIFMRRLALHFFGLALACFTIVAIDISDVQSRQENVSLSEHTAIVESRQLIIDQQQKDLDNLEAILSYALGEQFSGQGYNTMTVTATAYTARKEECNAQPWLTASGTPSRVGVIAVSRDMEKLGIKMGDMIIIKGMGLFRVEDRMNKRWKKRIDILHANLQAAKLFAKKKVEIMWFDDKIIPVG